ncbi:MAG: DUF1573 domain-containing protein [Planctomycetaceae bacterium]|nr:DUF1573 domain-containing protein [Planctomycetaceae bacterium]
MSENGKYDFGNSRQAQELSHTFTLTNSSDTPVKIWEMKSSCSGTWSENAEKLVGKIIPAGNTVDLPVHLKTGVAQDNIVEKILIRYYHIDKL